MNSSTLVLAQMWSACALSWLASEKRSISSNWKSLKNNRSDDKTTKRQRESSRLKVKRGREEEWASEIKNIIHWVLNGKRDMMRRVWVVFFFCVLVLSFWLRELYISQSDSHFSDCWVSPERALLKRRNKISSAQSGWWWWNDGTARESQKTN